MNLLLNLFYFFYYHFRLNEMKVQEETNEKTQNRLLASILTLEQDVFQQSNSKVNE